MRDRGRSLECAFSEGWPGGKSDHQSIGELGCMQDKQLSTEIEVITLQLLPLAR